MADHGEVEYATAQGNDLPAHVAMYDRFVHWIVVGGAHVANIVLGLAIGGVAGHWLLDSRFSWSRPSWPSTAF
jgi:Bacterial aa3 type cytochrome c oxidase subunit IV